jgi:hypothetical protein
MRVDRESVLLLRHSMTEQVKGLAEESLYWAEELEKLDASPGAPSKGALRLVALGDRTVPRAANRESARPQEDPVR